MVRDIRSRANSEGVGSRLGHHSAMAKLLLYNTKCDSLPFSFLSKSQKRAGQEAGTEAVGGTLMASQTAVRSTSRMLQARAEKSRTALCILGVQASSAPSASGSKVTKDALLGDRTELNETCSDQTLSCSGERGSLLSGAGRKRSPVPKQRGREVQHRPCPMSWQTPVLD